MLGASCFIASNHELFEQACAKTIGSPIKTPILILCSFIFKYLRAALTIPRLTLTIDVHFFSPSPNIARTFALADSANRFRSASLV